MALRDSSLSWQRLKSDGDSNSMQRSKIPGGWLVKVEFWGGPSITGCSITFVPDPAHKWDGGSLP